MFSGLISHLGTIRSVERDSRGGVRLLVAAPGAIAEGVELKDSIAVDGVCLTVAARDATTIAFDVVPESLRRSTLGNVSEGSLVNLELSLRLGDRLGGHLVYGHVDAVARITAKEPEGQGYRMRFRTPPELQRYVVEKGCVALDGVSLTVAATRSDSFEVALIPETLARTTLGSKGVGDAVNLEADPIARYALASAQAYGQNETATSEELDWAYEI